MTTFATIVPLIGGMTLGCERAFGVPPKFLLSYSPFAANDAHLVEHYKRRGADVRMHLLDEGGRHPSRVDVVSALCPCAGLSALSPHAAADNHNNRWMLETARYVLSEMRPEVFFGENAPRLGGKMGRPVLDQLRAIGTENGYEASLVMTSSLLHGIGQTRVRSFYFFWRGSRVPVWERVSKPHVDIEDVIQSAPPDDGEMGSPINPKRPTSDPFYRFVLEEIEGGLTHEQYFEKIIQTANVLDRIEAAGASYDTVAMWMRDRQLHREAARCERFHEKLSAGGNIMRKCTEVPKMKINAFVGHVPTSLTHPRQDRYITFREALTIMGMPADFQLLGGRRNANHVCQNVPVSTAADVGAWVLKALSGGCDTIEGFHVFDNRREPAAQPSVEQGVFS